MKISRSAKISLLLFIDVIFFLVELIIGYAVGSLALVADSFHMLNDVMSLVVALYALTSRVKPGDDNTRYSYGWHRAEILAALVNGVFLLALCLSIFLEAIQRFVSKPDVSNPKLVVIVGSIGLAFNIFGLFLFHDHDHDHGHGHTHAKADESTKQNTVVDAESNLELSIRVHANDDDTYFGHPAVTRQAVVQAAQDLRRASSSSLSHAEPIASSSHPGPDKYQDEPSAHESATGATVSSPDNSQNPAAATGYALEVNDGRQESSKPPSGGHNRKSGAMNMRALVLHVLGDALGNVGVIASGLIIWLTTLSWRFYFDPIISLVITVIIFSSALPLVKSASFILLQCVPAGVSLEEVKNAVLDVDGVEEVHELHIWQLSESKLIASLHVRTSQDAEFMEVAANIKKHLHDRGIHSVTIQPEYNLLDSSTVGEGATPVAPKACLLICQEDCNLLENACCPPPPAVG